MIHMNTSQDKMAFLRRIACVVAIVLALLLVLASGLGLRVTSLLTAGARTDVWVVLRHDDYCALSDRSICEEFLRVCERQGVPCAFCLIPFVTSGNVHDPNQHAADIPLSSERIEFLKDALNRRRISIALHGYSHKTRRPVNYSEWTGVPLPEQKALLAKGRALLESLFGKPVDIFVPPWNDYDENTVIALQQLGFRCLSANMLGFLDGDSGLAVIPATCGLESLPAAVEQAQLHGGTGKPPIIVAVIHSYDFQESRSNRKTISLPEFEHQLRWLRTQEGVKFVSFEDVLAADRSFHGSGQVPSAWLRKTLELGPPVLNTELLYWSDEPVRGKLVWPVGLIFAQYGLIFGAGLSAVSLGSRLIAFLDRRRVLSTATILGLAIFLATMFLHRHFWTWQHVTAVAASAGVLVGLVICRRCRASKPAKGSSSDS